MTDRETAIAILNVLATILKAPISATLQNEIEEVISKQLKKL